jgi:hypothetical protein
MSKKDDDGSRTTPPKKQAGVLVTRSVVPPDLDYREYKRFLRYDFFHSCAYCTMAESEARALHFTIDHYEPRRARPELVNDYTNLMYSCNACNTRKGNRCPPEDARKDGHRFFRPDHDEHSEHFEIKGIRVEPKTNVGSYSIEALDLNRQQLRKVREIRQRLTKCDELVGRGVVSLRLFQLDQLPQNIKGAALRSMNEANQVIEGLRDRIDALLRDYAKSDLIDPDPESDDRAREHAAKLASLERLYEGSWRAPRVTGASARRTKKIPRKRRQRKPR